MYQETFDVIGDYRIENHLTNEEYNLTRDEISLINDMLFSENSVWEYGCCDCASFVTIYWKDRSLDLSYDVINDTKNGERILLTEKQAEDLDKIVQKYFDYYKQ